MFICAVNKMSLLDYPGKTSTIVFTGACNLACGYCHNPSFVKAEDLSKLSKAKIPEEVFFNFLNSRKGLLEAVSICGGEPTIHQDLPDFIQKIKEMGYLVKLDTNGTNPKMLAKLMNEKLLDFIAMDLKYHESNTKLLGKGLDMEKVKESIQLIMDSNINYEFRSTILPAYHTNNVLKKMGKMIEGAKKWALQSFRPHKTLNPKFEELNSFSSANLLEIKKILSTYADRIEIRQ